MYISKVHAKVHVSPVKQWSFGYLQKKPAILSRSHLAHYPNVIFVDRYGINCTTYYHSGSTPASLVRTRPARRRSTRCAKRSWECLRASANRDTAGGSTGKSARVSLSPILSLPPSLSFILSLSLSSPFYAPNDRCRQKLVFPNIIDIISLPLSKRRNHPAPDVDAGG